MPRVAPVLCVLLLSVAALGPAPTDATSSTQRYDNGPECGALFDCTDFAISAGASTVRIEIHDDATPRVGGLWCFDSCASDNTGQFCDETTIPVLAGAVRLVVVVDENEYGGPLTCPIAPSSGVGEATSGTITVTFDPPPEPPQDVQSQRYEDGPECALLTCANFTVPAGATSVQLIVKDDVSPHAGAEWCYESCGVTFGDFCDSITIPIPPGVTHVLANVDPAGFAGITSCLGSPPGEAVSGVITAIFDPPPTARSAAAGGAQAFASYPAPRGPGGNGGEPSIGLDRATGVAFVQAGTSTLAATFDDSVFPATASWSDRTPLETSVTNVDPILATDAATGRTFAGGLEGPCSVLAATDDDGASWKPVVDACTLAAVDHETIGSGPWHGAAPPGASSTRAVYYCAQTQIDMCQTSLDGGITFLPPVPIDPTLECSGLFGHVKVAGDGTAFVPVKTCPPLGLSGKQGVYVSTDNGVSWRTRVIGPSSLGAKRFDPSVAATPSGWVYASWTDLNEDDLVSLSKDDGASWSTPTNLGAPLGVRSTAMQAAVAGDDDRAAVAFLGTTDDGDAFDPSFQGSWDLYVSFTYDGGENWTTVKATTDPVQRGPVCPSGLACSGGRNLLDFIDATVDAQGRVLVAYADGCLDNCTLATSTASLATIARQTCGPSLYASAGNVEGAGSCPAQAPPAPWPLSQRQPYTNGLACGEQFRCVAFPVPASVTSVHLAIQDDISSDVGAEWCYDACAGTSGVFCDATTIGVPSTVSTILVVVDPLVVGGVTGCWTKPAVGMGFRGNVTAEFS